MSMFIKKVFKTKKSKFFLNNLYTRIGCCANIDNVILKK